YLYCTKKNKEIPYLERTTDTLTFHHEYIAETAGLETKVRSNALVLSMVAQFAGAISTKIIGWVQNMVFLSDFNKDLEYTANLMEDGSIYQAPLNKFIAAADLGFDKIKADKIA